MSNTKQQILEYIQSHGQVRAHDLVRQFAPLSRVSVHKHLKSLVKDDLVAKVGTAPVVFYQLASPPPSPPSGEISQQLEQTLEENYLYISPEGQLLTGVAGFTAWLKTTHQTPQFTHLAQTYQATVKKFQQYRHRLGWIDASFKIQETFTEKTVTKLFYADFYSLPQFGKTKLGSLVLHSKQSQNLELIKQIATECQPIINQLIQTYKVEAVAFMPASLPRQIQFMKEFRGYLNLSLPQVELMKTKVGQVIVAQKSLDKLEERVINARQTIQIKSTNLPYSRILLIDDAVGSGASMHETASKILASSPKSGKSPVKVYGFAVVGSFKGFEVIKEV